MFNKKNYLLNCDVCDTRKMKEEDYSEYEKMLINADVVVVSASSKGILNRLPVTINQDCTIELADDVDVELKTVNGNYEITGTTMVQSHTLLIVNGSLIIHSGTEEVLAKYEKIHVNGSARCPKSLEGYLVKLSVNGSMELYPDDCVVLDSTFTIDKYFPLRAKEGKKYYVENRVILQDKTVNLEKLVQKKVQFITKQLIVPEEMVEACIELFDESVDFEVIPAAMTLHYGDAVLHEHLLEKEGDSIYVYGSLNVPKDCDLEAMAGLIKKLIVKEKVVLNKNQEENFKKINGEYTEFEYRWEGRMIKNKPSIKVDRTLLEMSPHKLLVKNTAAVKIASDVTPDLILERLVIENCAKVSCSEEQESTIAVIAQNVAKIGSSEGEELSGIMGGMKDLFSTKMINADHYIM